MIDVKLATGTDTGLLFPVLIEDTGTVGIAKLDMLPFFVIARIGSPPFRLQEKRQVVHHELIAGVEF